MRRCLLAAVLLTLATATVSTSSQKVDVVVVGGGLAGLSAASHLLSLRPNLSVLVLEVQPEVGGRIHPLNLFTVNGSQYIDIGSQWIATSHSEILQVVSSLGLTVENQQAPCGETKVLAEWKSRRLRMRRSASLLTEPPSLREIVRFSDAAEMSGKSVSDWLEASNRSSVDKAAVQIALQAILDTPANSASALNLLLLAGGEEEPLIEVLTGRGYGQALRVNGGLWQIPRLLSKQLNVLRGEEVRAISQESADLVRIRTSRRELSASFVIVATPPSLVPSIHFSPPLPLTFATFLQSYRPSGFAFYFLVTYNSPFWRANNVSGHLAFSSPESPLRWMTTFDVGPSSSCGECGEEDGILWGIAHFEGSLTLKERRSFVEDALSRTMGFIDAKEDVIDFRDHQFSDDEFIGGARAVLPPSAELSALSFFSRDITHGKVHFASSELTLKSLGTMNGAVISGRKAAEVVFARISVPSPSNDLPESSGDNNLYNMAEDDKEKMLLRTRGEEMENGEVAEEMNHVLSRESIVPIKESSITLHDSPISESFDYSTSTHYPPSSISFTTTPSKSTASPDPADFVYETTTHYPSTASPAALNMASRTAAPRAEEASLPSRVSVEEAWNEESTAVPMERKEEESTTLFVYHSTSHYPKEVTSTPPNPEAPSTVPPSPDDFPYSTSSHYPPVTRPVPMEDKKGIPTEPVDFQKDEEVEEAPAKMAVLQNEEMVPKIPEELTTAVDRSPSAASSTPFPYSTSSHYPSTQQPLLASTIQHFSYGNLPPEKNPKQESGFRRDEVTDPDEKDSDRTDKKNSPDDVQTAKKAVDTLEKLVPKLANEESISISSRLLSLLQKVLAILKGE